MDPLSTLVLARGLERLMIIAAGAAAVWMGWKLFYRLNDKPDQQAELSYKNLLIKLQRVGPRILFAFLGSAVFVFSIVQPLRITPGEITLDPSDSKKRGSIAYYSHNTYEIERWIVSLNTVLEIAGISLDSEIRERDRELLRDTTVVTEELRNELLKSVFGETDVSIWVKWRQDYAKNEMYVPEQERQTVAKVQKLVNRSLFDKE